MTHKLTKTEKQLLLRLRTALKDAGLCFEGRNITITDNTTGHYVEFSDLITDSDNSPMELYVKEHDYPPIKHTWVTTNKNTVKTVCVGENI